jgi:hypothetical protein
MSARFYAAPNDKPGNYSAGKWYGMGRFLIGLGKWCELGGGAAGRFVKEKYCGWLGVPAGIVMIMEDMTGCKLQNFTDPEMALVRLSCLQNIPDRIWFVLVQTS